MFTLHKMDGVFVIDGNRYEPSWARIGTVSYEDGPPCFWVTLSLRGDLHDLVRSHLRAKPLSVTATLKRHSFRFSGLSVGIEIRGHDYCLIHFERVDWSKMPDVMVAPTAPSSPAA